MKAHYYLIVLVHVIYLVNSEETWRSSGHELSNANLRQLSKIAKVTQNTGGPGPGAVSPPPRLSRSFAERSNSRRSRIEGPVATDEPARNASEVTDSATGSEGTRSAAQSATEAATTAAGTQPGRREATGKRKQPSKLSISPKPAITEGTPKPTKYHYYPHNQHIYLLPECAIQQVCNAVYVRLNYTQPLCACPSRKEPCSASLNADDMHTTELVTASTGKVLTLVKTCEPVAEMRICRAPRDWSLLALQNVRTGKSHYLVICRCPHKGRLEGPMSHDQPAYASVPGIRVYGMMCVRDSYRISRPFRYRRSITGRKLEFPWDKLKEFESTVQW